MHLGNLWAVDGQPIRNLWAVYEVERRRVDLCQHEGVREGFKFDRVNNILIFFICPYKKLMIDLPPIFFLVLLLLSAMSTDAKLGANPKPLEGKVAVITGSSSGR